MAYHIFFLPALFLGAQNVLASSDAAENTNSSRANLDGQLWSAAEEGDVGRMRELVAEGANINATNNSGSSILNAAHLSGEPEAVKFLLSHGASANLDDELLSAVRENDVELMLELIAKGANISGRSNEDGSNIIDAMAHHGHTEGVKLLLSKAVSANALLHSAAIGGEPEVVEFLLAHGADIEATDSNGETALFKAASHGNDDALTVLIAAGANVEAKANIPGYDGAATTPMLEAAADVEAEANSTEYGGDVTTPLLEAVRRLGKASTVKLLIEAGADVNGASTNKNETPLHFAVQGNVGMLQLLLEHGAKVDAKTSSDGNTPLHLIVTDFMQYCSDRLKMIEMLLAKGAAIEGKNNVGLTPLNIAASSRVVARLLLERGSNATNSTNGSWPSCPDGQAPQCGQQVPSPTGSQQVAGKGGVLVSDCGHGKSTDTCFKRKLPPPAWMAKNCGQSCKRILTVTLADNYVGCKCPNSKPPPAPPPPPPSDDIPLPDVVAEHICK